MYPNLSYLLHDLIGTSRDNGLSIIQMFGLFLGLAFFSAAYVLHKELKRKEEEGFLVADIVEETVGTGPKILDTLLNAIFGFVLGFKVPAIYQNFDVFKDNPAGFIFSGKGSILFGVLGFLAFGAYSYWQGTKGKLDQPKTVKKKMSPAMRVGDITVIAAIFGLLGARLFSILENLDAFIADPINQLFSGSGLTIYGGLILAFIANYIYVKRHRIPPIHVMDAIGPALILSYAVGRMGCQLSGDGDWGIVNEAAKPSWFIFPDWMWSYNYPHNVLNEGTAIADCVDKYCMQLSPGVFPTPIYEVIGGLIIFAILWFLRKRIKFTGFIFFAYAILMSVERFLIEFIRVNPRYDFLGMQLSQAQIISIGVFLAGIIGMVYWYKRRDQPVIMKTI